FTYHPAFLQTTATRYDAGFKVTDFVTRPEQSRQGINAWVEKETNGKIKELLRNGSVTPATRLVLVNVIYFKSEWAHEFFEGCTQPENFAMRSGTVTKVPMMMKREDLSYFDGGPFHMVSIPYRGNALSMIVLLPKKHDGLAELEKNMTWPSLGQWL